MFCPCLPALVKALYDYTATIPEEYVSTLSAGLYLPTLTRHLTRLRFDFQTGDIIAVTATPDDGWWSGELLDETRRRPGQNTFPSNFVTMSAFLCSRQQFSLCCVR